MAANNIFKIDIRYIVLVILWTSGCGRTLAQKHPFEVRFSYQIEAQLQEQKLRSSQAATLYSFLGDYHNANHLSELPVSWGVDSFTCDQCKIVDALPRIVQWAEEHQIVIISENHQKPQHRIFANEIIQALKENGFAHLGLETFGNVANSVELLDEKLEERGYPLNSPFTGTYTMEPNMGEVVRDAIGADYSLFAYERSEKIKGKDRDEIQADNVIRYMKEHPGEKIILLCGFHHAVESALPKRGKSYWLAKYIKDKTGIDPFTIYQDNFTEKFIENEHPILSAGLSITVPSVFVNESNELIRVSPHVDLEIIHPKTYYVNGRPHWQYANNTKKPVAIKLDNDEIKLPVIVSAYPVDEINSVPVDQIEIKHKNVKKDLVLRPGKYRIELFDGEQRINYEQIVQ